MSDPIRWDERYRTGETPWETVQPSSELRRVVAETPVAPCRAVELGCGTGASAVWLAQQGFEVTAIDLSPLAVERARRRAEDAGVKVRFLAGDVLHPPRELAGPFDCFFDRGCYHAVRREPRLRMMLDRSEDDSPRVPRPLKGSGAAATRSVSCNPPTRGSATGWPP
jgi:SAM-dependent methyltransferase